MRRSARSHALFWTVALGAALVDQVTKFAVFASLSLDALAPVPFIPGVIGLLPHHNYGALGGLGANHPVLLLVVSFAAMLLILWLFLSARPTRRLSDAALAVMMAGALGNQIDRVVFGKVRDFVHLTFWPRYPVFNLADAWLVIGVGLMLIALAAGGKQSPAAPSAEPAGRPSGPRKSGLRR